MKFYSEQAKHMWNGSNFALFRLKAKKIFKQNGRTLVVAYSKTSMQKNTYWLDPQGADPLPLSGAKEDSNHLNE